jgi:prepilin-type N-terminal cleavage/methylation domain-containing protein
MRDERQDCGFTLVELLVVIAIIAILAGLLLAVINSALTRADIARARTQMADIVNAIKNFYGEYNLWPCALAENGQADRSLTGNDQATVIAMLRGIDTSINGKKIVFLDVPADALSSDVNPRYLDPWGNPYVITMDTDFNNICTLTSVGPGSPAGPLAGRQIAVWSWGPKPGDTNQMIKSWE